MSCVWSAPIRVPCLCPVYNSFLPTVCLLLICGHFLSHFYMLIPMHTLASSPQTVNAQGSQSSLSLTPLLLRSLYHLGLAVLPVSQELNSGNLSPRSSGPRVTLCILKAEALRLHLEYPSESALSSGLHSPCDSHQAGCLGQGLLFSGACWEGVCVLVLLVWYSG